MIGERVAQQWLRSALEPGGFLSLHAGDPGGNGIGMLGDRLRFGPNLFVYRGREASNGQELRPGTATQGGLASYYGLWTLDGHWITGGRMTVPVLLQAGRQVVVEREQIVVVLS